MRYLVFVFLLFSGLTGIVAYSGEPVKKSETEPVVQPKVVEPPPTIVTLDTGKEILKITHDGKIYSDGNLVTGKNLTIATKQKAFEKCAKTLVTLMESN